MTSAPAEPTAYPDVPPRLETAATAQRLARFADVDELWRAVAAGGGCLVDPADADGTCPVTFVAPHAEATLLLLDTYTHIHRDDLAAFTLSPVDVGSTTVDAATFRLPVALRATVGTVLLTPDELEHGFDRHAWRALSGRSVALLAPRGRVGTGEGEGQATVIALPDALPQPFAGPHPDARPGRLVRDAIDSTRYGFPVDVWAYCPDPAYGVPQHTLVLCDGDHWTDEVPIQPTLDHLHHVGAIEPTSVVMFAARERAGRPAMLGLSPDLVGFLAEELLPWAAATAPVATRSTHRAMAGASLGGLATADVLRTAPDLIGNGIVQSASLWWPGEPGKPGEERELALWAEHEPGADAVRIFCEVGLHEADMVDLSRRFVAIARERGIDVVFREYCGGHDYVNWRGGIADGLIHLFGRPRPTR